ncbi:hypothetical protein EOM89_00725 [Candidatus Falkowbacteria bacterium]|nr:hypothetical protein [Candidatus Falkowbacteria bacterium]
MKFRRDQDAAAQTAAVAALQALAATQPELAGLRRPAVRKLAPDREVYLARLDRRRVVLKRFIGPQASQTVTETARELAFLARTMASGPYQVNLCLLALPEAGLVVLSEAPGLRLEAAISAASPALRARLMRQAGDWLGQYTNGRLRTAEFAPRFWMQRLNGHHAEGLPPARLQVMAPLKAHLDAQVPALLRHRVLQGATHGDFTGGNLHYHKGTIYGVDIQGETWMALANDVSRFLVGQALRNSDPAVPRHHGIAAPDWQAFLSSGLIPEAEQDTVLRFFIGHQIWWRLAEPALGAQKAARLIGVAQSYLETPPVAATGKTG